MIKRYIAVLVLLSLGASGYAQKTRKPKVDNRGEQRFSENPKGHQSNTKNKRHRSKPINNTSHARGRKSPVKRVTEGNR